MTIFAKNRNAGAVGCGQLNKMVAGIQHHLQLSGSSVVSSDLARQVLSMESIDPIRMQELESAATGLQTALETIANDNGISANLTKAQIDAGTAAGVMASNIKSSLVQPIVREMPAMEGMNFIGLGPSTQGSDSTTTRIRAALEAYDETENRNAASYSIAYNMQAARQDEFGEAFFPTIVVSPDQVGFSISIRLVTVFNEIRRQITGNLDEFKKRNIIEAVIDPTILRNDQTNIIPVYRDESKHHFVDSALIAPTQVLLDDEPIMTAPIAMGAKFSLLAISQTEALLETGLLDNSDSIDPSIQLSKVYLRVKGAAADGSDDEAFAFNVSLLPYANFVYSVQGNYRLNTLNFTTQALKINKDTKQVDGSASALLNAISVGEYTVRLGTSVSGSVNLELADTNLFSNKVEVVSVQNKDGVKLSLTDAAVAPIVAAFAKAELVGYELKARRTNLNRRQRGQLLDTSWNGQTYTVPLHAPISIPRPINSGDQNDSSDLAALVTATRIATSNAAVTELLRVSDVLQDFSYNKDPVGDTPAILGTGRYLVKPFYEKFKLDVAKEVDSLKSSDRAENIQALIVNKLRDLAYRMYRDSGYKAAADALSGGIAPIPTVVIGTDPVLARYINVTGDLRTLGGEFQVKIVSTLDQRMAGKVFMTFTVLDGGQDGTPNPLQFGNMAWKPELTMVLPMPRNGQISKELTVQPSYVHINHLPVLAMLEVEGIEDIVANKVSINMHSV